MKRARNILLGAGLMFLTHLNGAANACAACYGQSDSPMARGMNAGILALLGMIGVVLCGAATFFVMLARRASAAAKPRDAAKN